MRVRVRVVFHIMASGLDLVHHVGVLPGPGPNEEEPSAYVEIAERPQDRVQVRLARVPVIESEPDVPGRVVTLPDRSLNARLDQVGNRTPRPDVVGP